ncbi:hypothetical protein HO133_003997 [Letharia lupina]|uniref:Uncharacterized protein n=1 Tax=Letharia lupina TaxID=560253 RepID=A0A8H6F9C9_9LECA|nr:uncharacterized protein HO133_003997 [Letharia lupina]KAF6219528.1 hypothetical protein HO133_003997 [Letharia lupina]
MDFISISAVYYHAPRTENVSTILWSEAPEAKGNPHHPVQKIMGMDLGQRAQDKVLVQRHISNGPIEEINPDQPLTEE